MTDRPILFSPPMVEALLAGRKTQTRRLGGFDAINDDPSRHSFLGIVSGPKVPHFAFRDLQTGDQVLIKCRVVKGDRLWVRENCWLYGKWRENGTTAKGRTKWTLDLIGKVAAFEKPDVIAYYGGAAGFAFRPGIHMPRWASRITLGVGDVRAERLQSITPAAAIAEGIPAPANHLTIDCATRDPREGFASLWGSINGTASWKANPWVSATTFTAERRNIDA